MSLLSQLQINAITGQNDRDLAKQNNKLYIKLVRSGFCHQYTPIVKVETKSTSVQISEEEYNVVRTELYSRGYLSSPTQKRLIDGKEIR